MYGIGSSSRLAIAPWRILFLACGAFTILIGAGFLFITPNGPRTAWFLNEREKQIAVIRLARESEGGDRSNFSMSQLKEGLTDVKTYLVFSFGVLILLPAPVIVVSF